MWITQGENTRRIIGMVGRIYLMVELFKTKSIRLRSTYSNNALAKDG